MISYLERINEISSQWREHEINQGSGIDKDGMYRFLFDIFQKNASNIIVKKGSFRSDLTKKVQTSRGEKEDTPFRWWRAGYFPITDGFPLDWDPIYGKSSLSQGSFSKKRAGQLTRILERKVKYCGYKSFLHVMSPLGEGEIKELPDLIHNGKLWKSGWWDNNREDKTSIQKALLNLVQNGVFGDSDEKGFTYLLRGDFIPASLKGGGYGTSNCFEEKPEARHGAAIRLIIDPRILARFRHVYYDPEGAFIKEDFKKTFLIRGGIPFQAIKEFKLNDAYFDSK